MAEPATDLDNNESNDVVDRMDKALSSLNRSARRLREKARQIAELAIPLRKECNETAELARKCEEAVGDI